MEKVVIKKRKTRKSTVKKKKVTIVDNKISLNELKGRKDSLASEIIEVTDSSEDEEGE